MAFFAIMGVVTLAAAAVQLLAIGFVDYPAAMRWGMAAALLLFGTDHLVKPARYLPMMPNVVPYPREIVLFTGLCEIAGAIGLLIPLLRWAAGLALAVYFVCVFPANIKNALQGQQIDGLPEARWYYWARLPFQPLAIWWALFSAGVTAWPLSHVAA